MIKFSLLSLLSFVAFINLQDDQWKIVKTKNETSDRSECGLAVVDGKFYLLGGEGGAKPVDVFDPLTLMWTKKSSAPIEMHHFQAATLEKKIYVLEAFSGGGFPNQVPMPNVYSYDTEGDKWEKGIEIPPDRRRAGAGTAVYNGKIYLVGGIQNGHSSGTTSMFDVFDPLTNTWTILTDAPHIRDHCSATIMKDRLYVVGGRNTSYHEPDNFMAFFSHTVIEVDCYDFETDSWRTLPAKLPLGSGGGAVVAHADKLYYMGGERATSTSPNRSQRDVFVLNSIASSSWIEAKPLNKARNGMAAVSLDHKIYVVGGTSGPGAFPPGGTPNQMLTPGKPDSLSNRPPVPPRGNAGNNFVIIEVLNINKD